MSQGGYGHTHTHTHTHTHSSCRTLGARRSRRKPNSHATHKTTEPPPRGGASIAREAECTCNAGLRPTGPPPRAHSARLQQSPRRRCPRRKTLPLELPQTWHARWLSSPRRQTLPNAPAAQLLAPQKQACSAGCPPRPWPTSRPFAAPHSQPLRERKPHRWPRSAGSAALLGCQVPSCVSPTHYKWPRQAQAGCKSCLGVPP